MPTDIASPPRPLPDETLDTANITLTDLFSVEQLQRIQEAFAKATKVASIITLPNGVPVTAPSNFCRLCKDIIRQTEKGRANCFSSDAVIGQQNPDGPIIRTCLSGGIWDAGASISVNGKHIGNWLMGQVKNELIGEDKLLHYAGVIGADAEAFREALREVPIMSMEQFRDIANLGFVLASELSLEAFQNLQQTRHLAARKVIEAALRESSDRLKLLLELNNAVVSRLELAPLQRLVSARVREAMQCDAVCLAIPDANNVNFALRGLDFPSSRGHYQEGMEVDMLGSGAGIAFRTRKPYAMARRAIGVAAPYLKIVRAEGIRSEYYLPIIAEGRRLAILQLSDRQPDRFAAADIEFLTQVCSQIAIGLANANKFQQLSNSRERLAQENLFLTKELHAGVRFEEIVGESPALRKVLGHVATVAATDSMVLIRSETGTGKELIARAIHSRSSRCDRIFVKVNCAAIPAGLLESELFGHEKGAFTGAIEKKIGRFEMADGGTLFLDEIGDIPLELQPKLLRVLQEQEFERLGGSRSIKVDVRVVSATNRNLEQMMREGVFRPDLFYRLNVFPIHIPPLRERPDDILPLVTYFVGKYARKMNRKIDDVPEDVMDALLRYDWPGNVRELQNLIQRAVILSPGPELLSPFAELNESPPVFQRKAVPPSRETLIEMERKHIQDVLDATGWVLGGQEGAAARLGIPRTTLIYKMRRLAISRQAVDG